MGANAQTTVPTFVDGQVLTAAQQNQSARTGVPVFADTTARDAAFGGAGEKTLAEGQLCYLEDTNKVQYYDGAAWANLGSVTNVAAFTASGTWTVPAGVTYAIAHITGGGGGVGTNAGTGGTSSVAFASGTVSATGGSAMAREITSTAAQRYAGLANTGQGGYGVENSGAGQAFTIVGQQGAYIVHGAAVTPAASITITIGAGGTAGSPQGTAGGSGYVWIEYQV